MSPVKKVYESVDATLRLQDMGIPLAVLQYALTAGYEAGGESTLHDPPPTAGFNTWARIVRVLRDRLVPLGWKMKNDHNFATVVSPGGFAIAVASGDSSTGDPERMPSTKSGKGPKTEDAISKNQLAFADLPVEFPRPEIDTWPFHTWFLLHYPDPLETELRSELSLAAAMDDAGFVVNWQPRILLPKAPLLHSYLRHASDANKSVDASGGLIDVPVKRVTPNNGN